MDYAAPGVGKTSLLREADRIFVRRGIAAIWVTANSGRESPPELNQGYSVTASTFTEVDRVQDLLGPIACRFWGRILAFLAEFTELGCDDAAV